VSGGGVEDGGTGVESHALGRGASAPWARISAKSGGGVCESEGGCGGGASCAETIRPKTGLESPDSGR